MQKLQRPIHLLMHSLHQALCPQSPHSLHLHFHTQSYRILHFCTQDSPIPYLEKLHSYSLSHKDKHHKQLEQALQMLHIQHLFLPNIVQFHLQSPNQKHYHHLKTQHSLCQLNFHFSKGQFLL